MSMLLDLRQMRGSEDRVDRTCPAGTFTAAASEEYKVVTDVVLMIRVRKDGRKCRVTGRFETRVQLSCSRCLDPFEVNRDIDVDLLYLPQSANRGEAEAEISDGDLSTAFYRDEQIDLADMVREQLQLAVPMKPLCRDECCGLCPVCGTNLNIERCACDTRWHDPRLAALETLLPDREQR